MNIFFLDRDLKKCAEFHNNKHVVKMVTESAQLLSNAINHYSPDHKNEFVYRSTHMHHPCTKWVIKSLSHWLWLYDLTMYLGEEYTYRYGKDHLAHYKAKRFMVPDFRDYGVLCDPPQAMPDVYKNDDSVLAYRKYYIGAKRHIADWKKRKKPYWWV